jgi:uncharacterized protein
VQPYYLAVVALAAAPLTAQQTDQNSSELEALRQRAEGGNAISQYNLGVTYHLGLGVAVDCEQALLWYSRAVDQDEPNAEQNLGTMFQSGVCVEKNQVAAVRLFRLSARHGDAGAETNLGFAYYTGEGIPQDYAEAARWFQKAADQGQPKAMKAIGIMYATGESLPRDFISAHMWLNLACARTSGDDQKDNATLRERVAMRMSAGDIAHAQWLASLWKPRLAAHQ